MANIEVSLSGAKFEFHHYLKVVKIITYFSSC